MPYKAFNKDFTCKGKKYAENTTYEGSDKCATNKLHIKAKLGLKGFIKACVDFTLKKTKIENVNSDVENKSSGEISQRLAVAEISQRLAVAEIPQRLAVAEIPQRLAVAEIPQRLAVAEIPQRLHQKVGTQWLWQPGITALDHTC